MDTPANTIIAIIVSWNLLRNDLASHHFLFKKFYLRKHQMYKFL